MRESLCLLVLVCAWGCTSTPKAVAPEPADPPQRVVEAPVPTESGPVPDEAVLLARKAALTEASIRRLSRDTLRLQVRQDTQLRDTTSLLSVSLASLAAGDSVLVYSFDGRFWGVETDSGTFGYISEHSLSGGIPEMRRVQEGRAGTEGTSERLTTGRSGGALPSGTGRRTETCSSFSSRNAAQSAYDADPAGLAHLDTDHDGRACEAARFGSESQTARPRVPATRRRYHRGPRGGCYYINSSGNRQYVDRSLCR